MPDLHEWIEARDRIETIVKDALSPLATDLAKARKTARRCANLAAEAALGPCPEPDGHTTTAGHNTIRVAPYVLDGGPLLLEVRIDDCTQGQTRVSALARLNLHEAEEHLAAQQRVIGWMRAMEAADAA